jgi:sortase A
MVGPCEHTRRDRRRPGHGAASTTAPRAPTVPRTAPWFSMVRRKGAHARRASTLTVALLALGSLALVGAGLYLIVGVVSFEWDYHHVGHQLVAHEHALIAKARHTPAACTNGDGPVADVDGVQVHGTLEASSIGLDAPVVEGTDDAQLAVAVGHDPASVWPSSPGTVVLSAHDVTWFSRIGQLGAGSELDFVSPCVTYHYTVTDTKVVTAGTPVLNGPGSRLVLTSCYPFTALYLTPNRYLVEANLVRVTDAANHSAVVASYPVPTVPAPAGLAAQGLGLGTNDAPLGTLTVLGTPSPAWQQSANPLDVHEALLTLYFGALRAAEQRQEAWWSDLAPGVPWFASSPLWGASIVRNDSQVDAVFDVVGDDVTALSMTSSPVIAGGPTPGRFRLTLTAGIEHGELLLTSFQLTRLGA